jgi:hypothetical protein
VTDPAPTLTNEPADVRDYIPLTPERMTVNSRASAARARSYRMSNALNRAQKLWVAQAQPFPFSGLAAPEAWPHPVTTAALLHDLDAAAGRHLRLSPAQRCALVLWIAHTWIVEWSASSPRLALTSVAGAAGKSTALRLLAALTPRPLSLVPTSAQSLVGLIDEVHPTLLLDDAQTWLAGNRGLRHLMAAGHAREAVCLNAAQDAFARPTFSCFTPCAFATTAPVPAEIAKRCLTIALEPVLAHERPEPLPLEPSPFADLRAKAVRWANDEGRAAAAVEPQVPHGLAGSHVQNWRPLLAIAETAGSVWIRQAHAAAVSLCDAGTDDDPGVALLADLRAAFGTQDRLTSDHIVKTLRAEAERPWRHMALDARVLAQRLKPFGIRPRVVRTGSDDFARGYLAADFAEAFARYLPAPDADGACVHA